MGDDEGVLEVVEPVGEVGAAGSAQPPHRRREVRRAVDDVGAGEGEVGAAGVQGAEQLAAPGAHVDHPVGTLAVGEARR